MVYSHQPFQPKIRTYFSLLHTSYMHPILHGFISPIISSEGTNYRPSSSCIFRQRPIILPLPSRQNSQHAVLNHTQPAFFLAPKLFYFVLSVPTIRMPPSENLLHARVYLISQSLANDPVLHGAGNVRLQRRNR